MTGTTETTIFDMTKMTRGSCTRWIERVPGKQDDPGPALLPSGLPRARGR